jgi:rhodanese-related sulfurtransferase
MDPSEQSAEIGPLMKSFCISMESFLAAPHEETAIQPEGLFRTINRKEEIFIVDVRERKELEATGIIEGAVHIPVREVAARIGEFPQDLDTPLAVYCASGARSAHAAVYLRAFGYRNARNLEYGIHGWQDRNYPLIKMA